MTDTVRRPWLIALVTALLALHYALAVGSKFTSSTTSDEIVHLTGGFTFNHLHDYRLHPENGILPQRVAALPAALEGAKFPSFDQTYWRTSDAWVLGHQFFYETGEDHFPRLMAGRALIALFNVATGLLVFFWARRLFGETAALVSLAFFAFEPNLLAHGALATSDACMTFFLLASTGAWWRHLHDGRARWWWLSSLNFGLACVAKFSAPLLLPVFVALAAVRALSAEPLVLLGRTWNSHGAKFGAAALSALSQGLVAALVIWAFYGFRFSAANPALPPMEHFIRPWEWLDAHLGAAGTFLRALASAHLLPEGYLYGFAYVLETAQVRAAFLNGNFSNTGWPEFFLWTFALKTSLPLLGASAAALVLLVRRAREWAYRLAPLAVLFAVYWAFSITSHLNIGHRHILPTYPVLFIACGALAVALRSRLSLALLAVLPLWQAVDAVRVAPHFLAYFNPLAGGPAEGHRHLVDSSLDWGQDLPGLKIWLDQNTKPPEPVYLSYFGTGEPDYYGIRARRLMFVNGFKLPSPPLAKLEAGVYAISATVLEQVYSPVRGPWTLELEREFQAARAIEDAMREFQAAPADAASFRDAPRDKWLAAIKRYEWLRLARLCHYLRARGPDANVGYSIFIYRLSAGEVDAVIGGSQRAWSEAIERAVLTRQRH